jgi:hypothetical protein
MENLGCWIILMFLFLVICCPFYGCIRGSISLGPVLQITSDWRHARSLLRSGEFDQLPEEALEDVVEYA